jgi:anaerobic magnesium-protoporphyrin IX monomethyl ester cyclase
MTEKHSNRVDERSAAAGLPIPHSPLPTRRVLLLNPPGERLYLRDYFCSKVSQADYVHPPIDLVFLSGWLSERFEVSLVDAIVERLTPERALDAVRSHAPDAVVSLVGAASTAEDEAFLARLRHVVAGPIVVIGDLVIEDPSAWLEAHASVDAALTGFSTDSIARFLSGERDGLSEIAFRDGARIVATTAATTGEFSLPCPRHDLFLARRYRYGLARGRNLASVMTDYGCPFRCTFCVMPALGWRRRSVENVLDELNELKRFGARELFFLDQTFGLPRKRATDLLAAMERGRYGFGWVAFARADTSDDEMLAAMRRAGCHTVVFGVESGDESVLEAIRKEVTVPDLRGAFRRARRAGLRAAATILLGLPEETEESFARTMRLVRELDPDFLSINVAVPRNGTGLRRVALAEGLADSSASMDQSGSRIEIKPRALERDDVAAMRKRAAREFYLRPDYILRRAFAVRSLAEADLLARNAVALLRRNA